MTSPHPPTAIWWIRRDLRLSDSPALHAAQSLGSVIPVFILDPHLLSPARTGTRRVSFLFAGLRRLDAELRRRGSRLIIRQGEPAEALAGLCAETGAGLIAAEQDYTPYAVERDARVGARLPLRLTPGLTVHPPDQVVRKDGRPFTVFTPYSRAWKALPLPGPADLIQAPERLHTSEWIVSLALPDIPEQHPDFPAGEDEAIRRLEAFCPNGSGPIGRYAIARNVPAKDGTSGLSPYLRFGMISARQVVVAALRAADAAALEEERRGAEAFLTQLIWREFFISILYAFPQVLRQPFRSDLRDVHWLDDQALFEAWSRGETGFPLVDAALRQLAATGWMHNRARLVAASFLVKHLLIDWRCGEQWFMEHLLDDDQAANNGGWQWVAGTGTDAAPYFRIFNPVLQGQRFDPDGVYVRRWVPELETVPASHIHCPWELTESEQRRLGVRVGRDYPAPLVDLKAARLRALNAYAHSRRRLVS